MYCANCGTPLTQGLSYCNRCGANLRDRPESKIGPISAFLTAITIIGVCGLGIMLGGALVLRREAGLAQDLVAVFMLFTFLIVGFIEFMLVRNLSKLSGSTERTKYLPQPQPQDLRLPQGTPFGEPVSSVTENTTRTLGYVRHEQ